MQSNLAVTYCKLGQPEKSLQFERDAYSARLKLHGKEHERTLQAAINCASSLSELQRFKEARSLLRKLIPEAQRVLGETNQITLKMRWGYAGALYADPAATLDDLREAVATLEDAERIARRVFGVAHPLTTRIQEVSLPEARAALRARETLSPLRR